MDILRRSLAPVSDEVWEEINNEAKDYFQLLLSARKLVDVEGPKGWDFAAVPMGRLKLDKEKKDDVEYGMRQVQPLVESRIPFKLNVWELDNLVRGAEDIDLDDMEKAAYKMAAFEENAIYSGMKKAGIDGLKNNSEHQAVKMPDDPGELNKVLSDCMLKFRKAYVDGPFNLMLSEKAWKEVNSHVKTFPLKNQIQDLIGGNIYVSHFIDESYLVSARGGDFRLTLGNDMSIGYKAHDNKSVELYFTESFTFEIIDPAAFMVLK